MPVFAPSIQMLARGKKPAVREAFYVQADHLRSDSEARRLTSAVARGDQAAFKELYDCYQRRLFRLLLVLTRGDETLAEETVQATFITAAAKLRRVESENHLWNWLARVARQHVLKATRKRTRTATVISMAEVPEASVAEEADSILDSILDSALSDLEPDERRILESFYFDGISQKELAGKLHTTPKAVSSRLERARARLRTLIAKRLAHEY